MQFFSRHALQLDRPSRYFVTLHDELTDKLTFGIVNGVDEKASQRKEGKATKHVIKQAEVASSASMCE